MELLKKLIDEEDGQGLVEYALIIAVISLIIIIAGPTVTAAIKTLFQTIATKLGTDYQAPQT